MAQPAIFIVLCGVALLLLWLLMSLLRMTLGLTYGQLGITGLIISTILAVIVHLRSNPPRPATCSILETDIRAGKDNIPEVWLRVAWTAEGTQYRLKQSMRWNVFAAHQSSATTSPHRYGDTVQCWYTDDEPNTIYSQIESVPQHGAGWQIQSVACLALLSLALLCLSFRRKERPKGARWSALNAIQYGCLAIALLTPTWAALPPILRGLISIGALAGFILLIRKERRYEQRLESAIAARTVRNNNFGTEHKQGRWGHRTVRWKLASHTVDFEADVPSCPAEIALGPRGFHKSPPTRTGDDHFDERVQLVTTTYDAYCYALRVLTPNARNVVLRAMADLGAVLENNTITAHINYNAHATVLNQLAEVVSAASLLNTQPKPAEARLDSETNPSVILALAKMESPIPRHALTRITLNDLAPAEVRREAFSLLHPGESPEGRISLTLDEGQVSTATD